jgi:hypothetical protein
MGSNPISSTVLRLVFDSPPLQALHRCGLLELVARAYQAAVPTSIADETARSREASGPDRVPDLAAHPQIAQAEVSDDELARAGARFLKVHRATTVFTIDGRQIDRPELDAVLLARRTGAVVVAEDLAAVRTAAALAVPCIGTAELLCDLELAGHVADAVAAARAIRATRYSGDDLVLLASGTRRRAWLAPLTARFT